MSKPAIIKCSKCGEVPNIITDVCMKCGARVDKICGNCGSANPIDKNYCGQCGQSMTKTPTKSDSGRHNPPPPPPGTFKAPEQSKQAEPPKFRLEMQPIEATISEKDISFRRIYPGKVPSSPAVPGAGALNAPIIPPPSQGGIADRISRPVPRMGSKPGPKPGTPPAKPPSKPLSLPSVKMDAASFKRLSGALVTLALFGVLVFILYKIAAPHLPKFTLEMAAKSYLKKLSAGRYEEAYDLLSSNSKTSFSKADYVAASTEYYSKAPPWEFDGVEAFVIEPEAAMVKYQLKEGSSPWRTEYISFVKEQDKWTRPYVLQLFEPIEAAIVKRDYPQVMFLAQKLALTDPMDPRAAGYLCIAEFFMGLYDKSVESCKKINAAFQTYPGRFPPERMFWLRAYYADSLRLTQQYDRALEEYDDVLKFPGIMAKDQCPLYLSRADALVRLRKYDSALYDIMKAAGLCTDANAAEAQRKSRIMDGTAKQEAVDLIQRSRLKPDQPTVSELRRKALAAISEELGARNQKFLPADRWITAHISGPEYRVVLRQDGVNPATRQREIKDIYAFVVNLWTGAIVLEKDPSLYK